MAGRNKKIIEISKRHISNAEKNNRAKQEEKLKLGRDDLNAPAWLSDLGKKEFERVVVETEKINILDNLDLGFLAIYCNAYACYIDISKQINSFGYLKGDIETAGAVHPLLVAQEKYVKQIMQCSSKLGLAITDRLKLVVPTVETPKANKFIELIRAQKQG